MIPALEHFTKRARLFLANAVAPKNIRIYSQVGSGMSVQSGQPELDYVPELAWPEYLEEFKRLRNDPQISKELRSLVLPMVGADWSVEPASDDPLDEEAAQLLGANLYWEEGDDFGREYWCRTSWEDRLRNILTFLHNGFSVFQKVWRVEGQYIVFDNLKYIHPQSIRPNGWIFNDDDTLKEIIRHYRRPSGEPVVDEHVPADQLIVYTWDKEGSMILGVPFIRPMWGPFKRKTRFLNLRVVDKTKTAVGIPYFDLGDNPGPDELAAAKQLVFGMRAGNLERLAATYRKGQDFGWKEGGQSTKGLPEAIRDENEEISTSGGSQFLDLGATSGGGSRSLSGTMGAYHGLIIRAVSRVIIATEQMLAYEMLANNYPVGSEPAGAERSKLRVMPKLKCANIDPFELTRNVPEALDAIKKAVDIGDIDLENEVRTRYGFEERDPSTPLNPPVQKFLPGAPQPGQPPQPGGTNPGENLPPDNKQKGPATMASQGPDDANEAKSRGRVDLDRIRAKLETIESQYLGSLKAIRQDLADHVVHEVRIGRLKPAKPRDVLLPTGPLAELKGRLMATVAAARDFGRDELKTELQRQAVALSKQVDLAVDPATRRGAIAFSNKQAEVVVEVDVTNLSQQLQARVVGEYNRLLSQGLNETAIAAGLNDYLSGISDRDIAAMSRSSTARAFNLGRNVTIQEMKRQLEPNVVRVETIDDATCEPCKVVNGAVVRIDSPEYRRLEPPSLCDGGDYCRGIYVAYLK